MFDRTGIALGVAIVAFAVAAFTSVAFRRFGELCRLLNDEHREPPCATRLDLRRVIAPRRIDVTILGPAHESSGVVGEATDQFGVAPDVHASGSAVAIRRHKKRRWIVHLDGGERFWWVTTKADLCALPTPTSTPTVT